MERELLLHMLNLKLIVVIIILGISKMAITYSQAWSNISVKGSSFVSFSHHDNIIIHTRNFANWSDDRLKENEMSIESACETFTKIKTTIVRQEARYGK